MYKNRLLIRGVPRLAGYQINERRGLVKSIFWIFLILRGAGRSGDRFAKTHGFAALTVNRRPVGDNQTVEMVAHGISMRSHQYSA